MYVGCFNLANINLFVNSDLVILYASSDVETLLFDCMSHNGLKQINNIYHDKIKTNLFQPIAPLFIKSFDHSPITVEFFGLNYQPAIDNSFIFDFKIANFVGLSGFCISFEWNDLLCNMNLDAMYSKILDILHLGINHIF